MMEVAKNTTNQGPWWSIGKSTNCEAVDWSATAHAQNPLDLKSGDINRLVADMTGELRQQSKNQNGAVKHLLVCTKTLRALTPLFGNGAGAFRIGKNCVVLIKIGKKYKVLCTEVFIFRLI